MFCKVVVLSLCLVGVAWSYPDGPPVEANPRICDTMLPNHGAAVMTSATIFEIKADECYNENTTLNVHIKVISEGGDNKFFEGFFLQARKTAGATSYGTFSTTDDQMEALDCGGSTDNTIGHSEAHHYVNKVVQWKAPAGMMDNMQFVATIVREADEIWMNHMASLEYDVNCTTSIPADPYFTSGTTTVTCGAIWGLVAAIMAYQFY